MVAGEAGAVVAVVLVSSSIIWDERFKSQANSKSGPNGDPRRSLMIRVKFKRFGFIFMRERERDLRRSAMAGLPNLKATNFFPDKRC